MVLYNGEQRWQAPRDTAALIAASADSPLWPWQPQVRYYLLDMGAASESDLAARGSLAALLFRLEQPHEPDALAGLIDELAGWFRRHPGYNELKTLFTELVRQAIKGYEASVSVPVDLMEMRAMLANLGESWKKRWLAEGEAKGEAMALIRLAERRFGTLPAEIRDRILGADAASIERWLDRLMDAPTLGALFDAPN